MCGILGFVRMAGQGSRFSSFLEYFLGIAASIDVRGPDYFGVHLEQQGENPVTMRCSIQHAGGWFETWENAFKSIMRPQVCIAQFRGAPVTEPSGDFDLADIVQPLTSEHFIVTHNGQIANDKKLYAKRGFRKLSSSTRSDMDSFIFAHLMRVISPINPKRIPAMAQQLYDLEGSYAFAGIDHQAGFLYLARNYRGLAVAIYKDGPDTYLVWSSHADALRKSIIQYAQIELAVMDLPMNYVTGIQLPPMHDRVFDEPASAHIMLRRLILRGTYLEQSSIDIHGRMRTQHNTDSAVVVLSGGLDSMTAAAWAAERYHHLHLLHFDYGQRAEPCERMACQAMYLHLCDKHKNTKIVLETVHTDFFADLGGSALTDHTKEIVKGEAAQEKPTEWVPARNTVLISLAAAYADRHDIGSIVLGLNMEEGSVYADNSNEFYERMSEALQYGTKARPRIVMPLGNMMKHAIATMSHKLDVPLNKVWSCYHAGKMHCGECGSCRNRKMAFKLANAKDGISYASDFDQVALDAQISD